MMAEANETPRCPSFDGMKILSATKARDREKLGETVTSWMRSNEHLTVVDYRVSQSSDSEFHCVTITLLYKVNRSEQVEAVEGR